MKFKSSEKNDDEENEQNAQEDNQVSKPLDSPRFGASKPRRVDSTKVTKTADVRFFRTSNSVSVSTAVHKFFKAPVTKFYTNIVSNSYRAD